ncbi:hypothetical protein [Pseudoroseomonas cervicalis]|uniref:hypothetical protein n=1 Tax=Teichococcus cervicalis TaxID=204525 RepID=UPI0022F15A8B|nr:hypothetical protein [Pseudoroseomonas cervicalis]WBV43233.1 hypothetical protein PFY06_01285 [Pseudoroseomonas cervicalis]
MMRIPFLGLLLLLGACAAQPPQEIDRQAVLQEVLDSYRANLAGMQPTSAPVMPRLSGAPQSAAQLLGQSPTTLQRWLGEPRLRRTEGNAQIWLYQGPYCHLDVVMDREDVPNSPLRVSYAAARAAGTERRTEAACLAELARGSS